MAETVVWNKKLLIVAVVLGALAVVVYYAHDWSLRKRLRGETVRVLKWNRDMASGEEIAEADFSVVEVSTSLMNRLEGVVKESDMTFLTGAHLNRNVRKGDFVRYRDVLESQSRLPDQDITPGMRAFTIPVDPNYSPGEMLRVGGRVDLIGVVSLKNKPPRAYTLVKNLRVLAVGGVSEKPQSISISGTAKRYRTSRRVYRSITVEVPPQLAEKLTDLLLRIRGKVWVVVRNPTESLKPTDFKGINPQLEPILSQPLPSRGFDAMK